VPETVAVLGSGIVGASAAYHLSRTPGVRVVLVDGGHPGQATAAGAGIVAPGVSIRPPAAWYPFAAAAVRAYPPLLDALRSDGEPDAGYETCGGLFVATSDDEAARLDDVHRLIEERAREGMPNIGTVARLTVTGGAVSGFAVDAERIPCDAVVLATGAWDVRIEGGQATGLPIRPQRGQLAHLDVPASGTGDWSFVTGFHSHYLLAFAPNRVVAGATREDDSGFDARVTAGGLQEVLGEALRIAPGLRDATLAEVRTGLRPVSPDGLPLLGHLSGLADAIVATGLGPSGLTLGPYAGAIAARLAVGEQPPGEVDLAPFDPDRFAP
jgi:D-amino-acid dehydrogenase